MSFFIEDFRCAEIIPGTMLVKFVFFGLVSYLLGMSGVLKKYLVTLDGTTVIYTGFDSTSLRRLPTDYRAHALVLAALCVDC